MKISKSYFIDAGGTSTAQINLGSVRISFLEGDVQMRTTEAGDWVPAAVNTPLDEGDELWVPEGGRMEFQLNTGTSVRLDQNSADANRV